ncbi:hypothetical protein ACWPKS_13315 [Coraliomargarita sp. W4R72]
MPDHTEWRKRHTAISLLIPSAFLLVVYCTSVEGKMVSAALLKNFTLSDFASIFVASCALFVSIWSVRSQQRHNKQSVRPKLFPVRVGPNRDGTRLGVYLRNHGLGPAYIKQLSFEPPGLKKKISQTDDLQRIFDAYDFDHHDLGQYWLQVIPKDGLERILWLEETSSPKKISEFNRMLDGAYLYVEYESSYGETDFIFRKL